MCADTVKKIIKILYILESGPSNPGGALSEKWVTCMCSPIFNTLLAICKTPISAFFSSQDPVFTPKSQNADFPDVQVKNSDFVQLLVAFGISNIWY